MNKVHRLYEQFIPNSYYLFINPNKESMTFTGKVVIEGRKSGRPSKRLTFHTKDLVIDKVSATLKDRSGKRQLIIERTVVHKAYDELRIHFNELIYPGEYTIEIEYHAPISRPMSGLYPCYFGKKEKQEIILATQFESHHAREVFPCIDEPEAKAMFDLELVSPVGEVVLANTTIKTQRHEKEQLITLFDTTPKMSTYLLAFAIGNIKSLSGQTKSGIEVRTYATSEHYKQTDFALNVAIKCLDYYEDYFGIKYPLPKCDLLALPDFASGAMENWGLITFREQALLVDSANTSLSMKQYVANVVAHELTHQWFGNLVTMRWWNDLWLNESFASLMSYLAIDHLFPEWQVWTQFVIDEQSPALKLDSLVYTHPINVTIKHPDEIRTIFDNISYEKGASVLYMLMNYLGKDNFRKGLTLYLEKHSYANTVSSDLWAAWEKVAEKPISDLMNAWTTQAGYPLIKASLNVDDLSLTQERFYLNPAADRQETVWPIPLFPSTAIENEVMGTVSSNHHIQDNGQPLIINHERASFCRVIYDASHLSKLASEIATNKLSVLDRQGILSDSFEASKAGYQSTIEAIKLLDSFSDEDNVIVWDIISANIVSVRATMDDEELRNSMNPFIQQLIKKQYERLGWESKSTDNHFDMLLRPLILGLAAASDQEDALAQVNNLFNGRTDHPIDPDLRGVVYTTIARHGSDKEYDLLIELHNNSTNSEERVTLAAALTNFKQPVLIERALGEITSGQVRLQDVSYWISYSFANRYAKMLTWEWMKSHWEWLRDNLGTDLSFFMMPRYAGRAFSDAKFIPEFKSFFDQHLTESFVRPLNQAIESITWQSAWRDRDLIALKDFFTNH